MQFVLHRNRFFDVFSTYCQRIVCVLFFFQKIFLLNSKSRLFCLKYYYNKKFMFMILLKHVLRIRQIMFKNSIILAEKKFFSTYKIIKFFLFLFIFQDVFHFIFFVFAYENYFRRDDDICICII